MSGAENLVATLTKLRGAVDNAHYLLITPRAAHAKEESGRLLTQLDEYLLPRLAKLDAPLLVVIGGSTGAGKSTLINSLVQAPVSTAGVLRPTTRAPVLICHPADGPWFQSTNVLPGLSRYRGRTTAPPRASRDETQRSGPTEALHLIMATGLTPGLAFVDAPDIDSIVDANRELASELFAAADLWLFVTTAARYADAVPWDFLHEAKQRDVALAILLNRVPPEAMDEVRGHLEELLAAQNLDYEQLFALPEVRLDDQGLLPETLVAPIKDWFSQLAGDAAARATVVRRTLDGALRAIPDPVRELADAMDEQRSTAEEIDEQVNEAYRAAAASVDHDVADGSLLRGEVLARWQELVGTGELLRALQVRIGHWRDKISAAFTGRVSSGEPLREALTSGVAALILAATIQAAETASRAFDSQPLLAPTPRPVTPEEAERLVRDWQAGVLELVRAEGSAKRGVARVAAYTVNATGLLVMIAVFTATHFIPTGAEVGVAAGTTIVSQKLLEAIFGDQVVRALANQARKDLSRRVHELFADRRADFAIEIPITDPAELRTLGRKVERERQAWGAGK